MLKLFRKKAVSRMILWGLLILILPAFVMWGSASMSRSKDKGPEFVGIIDNKKISFDEFYNAIVGVRSQIILNYYNQPRVLEMLLGNKPLIAKIAWDRLLMIYDAKKQGMKAGDKEVIGFIKSHPLFMRNDAFDEKFYSYILSHNIGLEPRAFEEIVRQNLIIQKLSLYVTKDMSVPDEEVVSEYKKEFAKIKISYVLMDPKDIFDKIRVEESAIKDFYEKHKSELKLKSNLKGASPDRTATLEESKDTIEKYLKNQEAVKILKTNSQEAYDNICKAMNEKKETFAAAAAKLKLPVKNTDLFSKTDKLEEPGDTPTIIITDSGMKNLEVSKPIEISRGFIIFQLTERKDPDMGSFPKEKDEYAKKVKERRLDSLMEERVKKLEETYKPAIKFEDIEKYYR